MKERVVEDVEGGKHSLYPIWATRKTIRELLGVPEGILVALVVADTVDFRQLADTQQASALYRFKDVLDWVESRPTAKVSLERRPSLKSHANAMRVINEAADEIDEEDFL